MDYSIAFILPGRKASRTVENFLKERNLDYPVVSKSTEEAVEVAKGFFSKGLRIVISYGLTMMQIEQALPVVVMELPFSGLDTLVAVNEALSESKNGKIVHVGTPHMYHHIKRSLSLLNMDPDLIYHCKLNKDSDQTRQVQGMLDQGFDTIIGGYKVTDYAKEHGANGIEFDVDELSIEIALLSAQSTLENMLKNEEQTELERTILNSISDASIVIDRDRKITQANMAARDLFSAQSEDLVGILFEDALQQNGLLDVDIYNTLPEKKISGMIPVILREIPITIDGINRGSVVSVMKVSEIQELEYMARKDMLLRGHVARHSFSDLIGDSPSFLQAKEQAEVYANYDSPILIYGETGTGKELFAQSIHNASPRKDQPFVAINCAALTETLIDSELFGYVKGAFTGASKEGKQGLFEIANNGTIFLDEIAETSLALQAKLLRVIQEGEVIRVGGDKVIHVNTRVICATNKNLPSLIKEGKFRDDLYYRLCVLDVKIPPLRERPGDIRLLANVFLENGNTKYKKNIKSISRETLSILSSMPFMGNVRELRSVVERMVIMTDGPELDNDSLNKIGFNPISYEESESSSHSDLSSGSASSSTDSSAESGFSTASASSAASVSASSGGTEISESSAQSMTLKDAEKTQIQTALIACGQNKREAAKLLGIDLSTLYRKIKTYGL